MALGHVTKTGNISIPKTWRDELGIEPDSAVIMERIDDTIIIQPLKRKSLQHAFRNIDTEMKRKKSGFTKEEAIKDDFYD